MDVAADRVRRHSVDSSSRIPASDQASTGGERYSQSRATWSINSGPRAASASLSRLRARIVALCHDVRSIHA